jgi:hypothetical protein
MMRLKRAFLPLACAALCWISVLGTTTALADVNIPALSCQAPFLNQAETMRWHEHYLLNPLDNQDTWVVCPVAYETNDIKDPFIIGVYGNKSPAADGFHVCYLNIVDIGNQDIPGFIDNPGQRYIYSKQITTQNPINTLWWSASSVTFQEVLNGLGGGSNTCWSSNPADCWGITVNCKVPVGHAVGMVSLY